MYIGVHGYTIVKGWTGPAEHSRYGSEQEPLEQYSKDGYLWLPILTLHYDLFHFAVRRKDFYRKEFVTPSEKYLY